VRGLLRIGDRHGADARRYSWHALDRFMVIQTRMPALEAQIPEHPGMQTLRALRIGQGLGALRRWAGAATERRAMVKPVARTLREGVAHWTYKTGPAATAPLSSALESAFNAAAAAAPDAHAQALRALIEMHVALDAFNRSVEKDSQS
jgi:hypothetical protein